MKAFLIYIWQILQNLVGLFVLLWVFLRKRLDSIRIVMIKGSEIKIVYIKWLWAVSLGCFIFVPVGCSLEVVRHELGHCFQSRRWGPLYLFTVGLVSASRNIFDRLFHRKWQVRDRMAWYYGSWPEKQASKMGYEKIGEL